MEDAREFISLNKKSSIVIGIGVGLILLGVSLLILLSTLFNNGLVINAISPDAQGVFPVIVLFISIAVSVGLFIYSGIKLEKYKFIDKGLFELSTKDKSVLSAESANIKANQTIYIIIGVVLCILSPVAIFTGSLFGDDTSTIYGVCIMFVVIALAVFILVTGSSAPESYKKLLKTDEFDPVVKKENKVIGAMAGIIWPLAVCIFLYTGIVLKLWHINWVIFPITGILFGGLSAFYKAIKSK